MPKIIVIAHNIRSTHNVGSIFRTCDGFGVAKLLLTGYTPYPVVPKDQRLPHLARKITKDIHKTALGAEITVPFEIHPEPPIAALKAQGYRVVALEQSKTSVPLVSYRPSERVALILGEEVKGIPASVLKACDDVVEIPMNGSKESFNVSVAAGIALYQLTFVDYN